MQEPVAWTPSGWQPFASVAIRLDDWGFLQGVVAVDRLRTHQHRAVDAQEHVQRFLNTCQSLEIRPSPDIDWLQIIDACVAKNRSAFQGRDFGLVLLATPGRVGSRSDPTLIVHPVAIPWNQLALRYNHGQPLVQAIARNVPAECWSPSLKTRARLQYYLADIAANRTPPRTENVHRPAKVPKSAADEKESDVASLATPGAVLLDTAGNLTETSQANLIIVHNRTLLSPPSESILFGISLQRTLGLLQSAGYTVRFAAISVAEAVTADGILLCGTTGCVWPAASWDDHDFDAPTQSHAYQLARRLWCEQLGYDYTRPWQAA